MTLEERFWAKVDKESSPDGCWLYFGFLDKDGYGVFRVGEKNVRAHRFSYELATGSIPDGLTIDHVVNNGCTNRNCVNPSHLEPVTTRINILRGDGEAAKNARKTHCLNGHPLEGQNLIIQKWPDGSIKGRGCRICKNAQDLARYHRMKTIEGRSRSKERPYNS